MVQSGPVFTGAEYLTTWHPLACGFPRVRLAAIPQQVALSPNNAVYRLAGRAPDCANGERLGGLLGTTVIASGYALLDDLDLSVEPCRPTLYQRYVRRQAHLVDMAPRLEVVQRVENEVETPEKRHSKLRVLDIRMRSGDRGVRIEGLGDLFRDLQVVSECCRAMFRAQKFLPGLSTSLCVRS